MRCTRRWAPLRRWPRGPQVMMGLGHLSTAIDVLKNYSFETERGQTMVVKEPVGGVCGLITPWNWPINQIACKVFPALAAGCTMVLKPSEVAPFSGQIFTEIIDAAGLPAGVYNMVFGDGPGVGAALSSHPGIDMVSFTGSTRAGIEVARNAAPSVKRVSQELGGKSPNIVLDDEAFGQSVAAGVAVMMMNSGQSCNAPSRMLVPNSRMDEAVAVAKATAEGVKVGDLSDSSAIGPVASRAQFEKVQGLIEKGIAEGAKVVAGGPGRPEGLDTGYYVRPTVFADVNNDMTIAREEIFGPVLCILGYDNLDQAVEIGNDTDYGLYGYVSGADLDQRVRWLGVSVPAPSRSTTRSTSRPPLRRYKTSGNGREWGRRGFRRFPGDQSNSRVRAGGHRGVARLLGGIVDTTPRTSIGSHAGAGAAGDVASVSVDGKVVGGNPAVRSGPAGPGGRHPFRHRRHRSPARRKAMAVADSRR